MDRGHQRELTRMSAPEHRPKIRLMRSYDRPGASPDVDDPYYGGQEGFERMYEVLEACCRNLLDALLQGDTAAPDAGPA
jgi:protein-tyrosine phosphatase